MKFWWQKGGIGHRIVSQATKCATTVQKGHTLSQPSWPHLLFCSRVMHSGCELLLPAYYLYIHGLSLRVLI